MSRFILISSTLSLLAAACAEAPPARVAYAVSIHPLHAILSELCAGRAEVRRLATPGVSPHTYAPQPADARTATKALALFYVSEDLDGWAAQVPAAKTLAVAALVPEELRLPWMADAHDHGEETAHEVSTSWNPHFWGDPDAVRAVLPALVAELAALDPEGEPTYQANAERFAAELEALEVRIAETLAPVMGRPVAVFHPSWDYFLRRFGIPIAGTIEPFPGKEATAKYLKALIARLSEAKVRVLCTEPQLPRRPAEVVAEACENATPGRTVRICEIDPIGGVPGRVTYAELLEYNAAQLAEALQ